MMNGKQFAGMRSLLIALLGGMLLMSCSNASPRTDNMDGQMSWPFNLQQWADQDGKFYINGEAEGYVSVFDAQTLTKLKTISFWDYEYKQREDSGKALDEEAKDFIQKNARPHHSWISPGGKYNYVSNNSKGWERMWVVDTRTDNIVTHIDTGGMGPLHGSFSPFRDIAAFGAVQDKKKGMVTFIDLKTHKVIGTVKTSGIQTRDMFFTPDNKHLYVSNSGWDPDKGVMGGVDMIDIDAMKVVKTFDIPGSRGMKMNSDGTLAAVASIRKGFVAIIDAKNHKILAKVDVGSKPNNVQFHPDNTRVYVGLAGDKQFAVIDLKTMSVKAKIAGGKEANAVYFPPGRSDIAIATNEADDFVTVIDTKNDTKIKDILTPLGAHNISYSPDGKRAIVSCRKSREAVFLDVEALEEIDIIPDAGHANNGVRWVPYGSGLGTKKPYDG